MFGKKTVIKTRFKSVFVASMTSMVGVYILILTDNIAAGQIVEDDAAAAMTLIYPIFYALIFVSYLIADGLGMMFAYAKGRQDKDETNRLFSIGIILSVILGIIFMIILIGGKEEILSAWKISPHLMNYAADYYSGVMLLPVIMFLNIFIYTIFIAQGREKVCLFATTVSFAVNVILDIVFCKLIGVMGISLALLTGYLVGFIIQIYYLTGGRNELKFIRYFSLKKTLQGILYSFYHSIDTLCLAILPLILSSAMISQFGEENLIVVTIAVNLLTMILAIYTGLIDCLQPMICQYHAEKNLHSVKKTILLCLKVTAAIDLLMTVVGIIFANFLPILFNVEDPNLVEISAEAMRYLLVFTIFLGNTMLCTNYYIYIERMNYGALMKIVLLLVLPYISLQIESETMNEFWFLIGVSFLIAELINLLITKIFFGGVLMIDKEKISRQLSYDIESNVSEIKNLPTKIENDLSKLNVEKNIRDKIISSIEEIGMKIIEGNKKNIQLEISILADTAQIILMIRDNGEPLEFPAEYNYSSSGDENCIIREIGLRAKDLGLST